MGNNVNIWALEKELGIRHVLLMLTNYLGADAFIIEEEEGLHPRSVFLQHSHDADYRAYLYTLGQENGRYGLHLEYPEEDFGANLIDAYENLSLRSLVDILSVHFEVPQLQDDFYAI